MGKEIQIVPSDRPVVQEPIDIPAGVFVRENKMYAKYTDPKTLRTIETDVFDGAGEVLPSPTAEDDGKVLGVEDGAYALVDSPIPSVSGSDKDKYLHTNSTTGDLEWANVETFNADVNLADEYSATSTYAVGDLVIHENMLYECNTAIASAEEWNSSHWTGITIEEYVTKNKVVANPTLAGTEDELTGLEVAGTKYKMPSGSSSGGSSNITLITLEGTKTIAELSSKFTELGGERQLLTIDIVTGPHTYYTGLWSVIQYGPSDNPYHIMFVGFRDNGNEAVYSKHVELTSAQTLSDLATALNSN